MRIAVSGAQSVGKSTVCENLRKKLSLVYPDKSIAVIGGISRSLIETHGIRTDEASSLEDYFLYNAEYISRLLNATADIIIHDRTLLDSMAYQLYNNNTSDNYNKMLREIVKWFILDINYYFIIPIQFDIVDDGVRYANKKHQAQIARIIMTLLTEFQVDYTELYGDTKERIKTIMNVLRCSTNVKQF